MTRSAHILAGILTVPVLLTSAAFSFGQTGRSYPFAHVRFLEGDATIQRALEPEAGEAGINVPVMPGDRLWTASYGRVEIGFADGAVLHMDERTKVDFTAFGETDGAETLLRLWNGSLLLRIEDPAGASYRIDTPAGSVFTASEGLFRIDVDQTGSATLSVYEGVAELASEAGSVLVRTGQRSFVQSGLRPESPYEFNTALFDDFASWSDRRQQLQRYTQRLDGIPDEPATYSGELQRYGSWRHDPSYGVVWYPTVSVGWSPYTLGRWSYTSFGWTWISYEPWGWAPYHYGRWGYGSLGWYWIPGAHWGPAWVSWAFGPSWVGWCPLGYYDRPLVSYRSVFDYRGGRGGYRGGYGNGWNFVNKDHFRSVPVERTRLRVEDVRATADQGRLFESGAILDRDLRPVAVGTTAMSRATETSGRSSGIGASTSSRGAISRGRAPSSTLDALAARGRYAVPRFAPSGSSDTGASSGSGPSYGIRNRDTTEDSTGGTDGAGNTGTRSPFSRIGSGVFRGETSTSTTNDDSSTPSSVLERTRGTGTRTLVMPSPSSRERSMGSSEGSKDFFERRPSTLGGSRSTSEGGRATPRSGSSSASSDRTSSRSSSSSNNGSSNSGNMRDRGDSGNAGSRNNNRNENRGSSRPRN